jgi:hypothetical protein
MTVEREGENGLLVTFSDGTTAGYVTEELLELRPFREPTIPRRYFCKFDFQCLARHSAADFMGSPELSLSFLQV